MPSLIAIITGEDGQTVGSLPLNQKQFKTGSKGFWGQGKLVIDGKRYQAQMQIVLIKGQDDEEKP